MATVPGMSAPDAQPTDVWLSVDQLAARTGVPSRTIRFWTTKGLVAPPHLEGRSGRYDARHVATVELVRDLQATGFSLTAVEAVLQRLPREPTAADIALFGSLATPWQVEGMTELDRAALDEAFCHPVTDEHLAGLEGGGMLDRIGEDRYRIPNRLLERVRQIAALDPPQELLVEAVAPVQEAADRLADELIAIFDRHLRAGGPPGDAAERERLRALADVLRGTTVELLTTAFQRAVAHHMTGDGASVTRLSAAATGADADDTDERVA